MHATQKVTHADHCVVETVKESVGSVLQERVERVERLDRTSLI